MLLPPIISSLTLQSGIQFDIQFECVQIPPKSEFEHLPHDIGFVFRVFPGTPGAPGNPPGVLTDARIAHLSCTYIHALEGHLHDQVCPNIDNINKIANMHVDMF
jgi:hypothetical protein